MALFDGQRLKQALMRLDIEGLRRGDYADRYFTNVAQVLEILSAQGYSYQGANPRALPLPSRFAVGDVIVEAQVFNRRAPIALVGGIDVALAMLRYASGFYAGADVHETWADLEVEAVQDGDVTTYDGNVEEVLTVMEIRGRYRDFAILETPILGVLTRASRVATNVYEVLQVANGKRVLFFPARFDLPEVQRLDGYAYWLAVQRYNLDYGQSVLPLVSTHAQAEWWGGRGTGTIPHALIACFLADEVETMVQFARCMPLETPRILLADFNNDVVRATLATLERFWQAYQEAYRARDEQAMRRWTLNGVRLDTSGTLRDASLKEGDPKGVSPLLVRTLRRALNNAWASWGVPADLEDEARRFCEQVQIVVSGGFNREKVEWFERSRTPVDAYGVGSSLLANGPQTNTDFTMDVVRVCLDGQWHDIAKVGRKPAHNPDLRRVDLGEF